MNWLNVLKLATIWNMMFVKAPIVIPFDLKVPQNYQTFVTRVRNAVADPKRTYDGLPIIKAPDSKNKYLYIQVNAGAISITLQLQTSDLYLVAYHDKDNLGKDRAFYFKEMIGEKDVFPNVKNIKRELTKFDHDYDSIEGAAQTEVKLLKFCLPNLENAMRNAYGVISTDASFKQLQALFILYSIEIVSEAARFTYIEQKTVKQLPSDVEVASLVKKWNKLSKLIVTSKDGIFKKSIDIQVAENPTKIWTVKTVAQIKPDMGILGYVEPTTQDTATADEL